MGIFVHKGAQGCIVGEVWGFWKGKIRHFSFPTCAHMPGVRTQRGSVAINLDYQSIGNGSG